VRHPARADGGTARATGRLTLGNLFALIGIAVVITAAAVRSFPLLIVGVVLIGAGNAGNLQSRFAATDLARRAPRARPRHRRLGDDRRRYWARCF
jgi:hypothetical protein